MGPAAATQTPSSLGQFLLWLHPEEMESPHCVFTARQREKDGDCWRGGGCPPCPPPKEGARLLYFIGLGWLRCGAEGLGLPPSAQLHRPRPRSQSSRAGAAAWPRFQGSGISAALTGGSGADKARSGPRQAAPPLRTLGETTASGGRCGMDAGAAANGGAGRWAGAMATANGGTGRGPPLAVGRRAFARVQGCVYVCG